MTEYFQKTGDIPLDISNLFKKLREFSGWTLLYSNKTPEQAEILLLTGMLSGAGVIGLFTHGARKSLVFIKLIKTGENTTRATVIAGGTESWLGLDFGRHKRNVEGVFNLLNRG